MLIGGIILIIAGAVSAIYGITLNNDLESQMQSLFMSGSTNPGTVWIIVGLVAAVIDVILAVRAKKR